MRHVESHVFCFVFFKEEIKSFVKLWPYVAICPWYMFVQCFSTVSENSENIYKSSLSMIHTPSYLQITLTWAKKPGSNHQLVVNPLYFYFWMSENILTKIELKTHRFLKTQQEKLVPKWHFFEPNLRQNVWIIPCFYSQDAPTLAQSKTMLKNTFFNAFYTITEFLGLHFNLTHKKINIRRGQILWSLQQKGHVVSDLWSYPIMVWWCNMTIRTMLGQSHLIFYFSCIHSHHLVNNC